MPPIRTLIVTAGLFAPLAFGHPNPKFFDTHWILTGYIDETTNDSPQSTTVGCSNDLVFSHDHTFVTADPSVDGKWHETPKGVFADATKDSQHVMDYAPEYLSFHLKFVGYQRVRLDVTNTVLSCTFKAKGRGVRAADGVKIKFKYMGPLYAPAP